MRSRNVWGHVLAVLATAGAVMPRGFLRPPGGRIRRGGQQYPRNGEQECARRRRQIARGQLTYSNGLYTTDDWAVHEHGRILWSSKSDRFTA